MGSALDQPPITDCIRLYARTGRRAASRYGLRPAGILGPRNPAAIFIVGCPRSGTTFTAKALGSVPGFTDLGEVNRLKAGIPGLYRAAQSGHADAVARRLRLIISMSQRIAMAAPQRAIEQTPESSFLIPQLARAFPGAHFVHLVRDGRDVASSLVERGWLAGKGSDLVTARAGGEAIDDAGHPFGGYARFWVEPGREADFESAGETRRCAWAWRRYVSAALSALAELKVDRVTTIRYEELVADPPSVGIRVAAELGAEDRSAEIVNALSEAHNRSVASYEKRLDAVGIADVLDEAGPLLQQLGYLDC